jgi:hypothetical protein
MATKLVSVAPFVCRERRRFISLRFALAFHQASH